MSACRKTFSLSFKGRQKGEWNRMARTEYQHLSFYSVAKKYRSSTQQRCKQTVTSIKANLDLHQKNKGPNPAVPVLIEDPVAS